MEKLREHQMQLDLRDKMLRQNKVLMKDFHAIALIELRRGVIKIFHPQIVEG